MKPTLVIMAAGMASRYGSMKQIQGFGPSGETIMDYSIYDAIKAGFGKVVFIIRKDFADDFKKIFDPKLDGKIDVEYVYQELDAFVGAIGVPSDRKKPWGTGHAVLCAHDAVSGPFAVINADDFYGTDAFIKANNFLVMECDENTYGIIAYNLNNTLSEHGSVSRGVIEVGNNNDLLDINERLKIYRDNGQIIYEEGDQSKVPVAEDAKASMNFWCFHSSVFPFIREEFAAFLGRSLNDSKAEFLIPFVADQFIKSGRGVIKVIPTSAPWFGVTYKEDAPVVQKNLDALIENKTYPNQLW
ncbi:MAG: nucleotidyltransferase [Bacteroidota bacterium]|nr:nucleotidyltransferase [Bacteroidota bacterium]